VGHQSLEDALVAKAKRSTDESLQKAAWRARRRSARMRTQAQGQEQRS
jgi:hypothetical protein